MLSKARRRILADPRIAFAVIFLVAFAVRCVFVVQWNHTPYATQPLLDAKVYHEWAQAIASGEFLRGKAFYQSPLYPYFLGLVYALFGPHFWLVGLINALFEAGTATLLSLIALRAFGSLSAAVGTGVIAAFYRPTIFYTAPVMKEPLGLFLLALFFCLFQRGLSLPRTRTFFFSGLVLGLAVLVRGNLLCLAPVALAVGFYVMRRTFAKSAGLFLLGLILAIMPATVHNYLASGDFVLTNYTDGFNLYIGNSPYANGTNSYPPEVSTDPVQEEMNTIWVATQAAGRSLSPSEISDYWRQEALSFMAAHPWRTIELVFNKAIAFWNGHEQFDNYDIAFIEKNFGTILGWPLLTFWMLTPLAGAGAVLLAQRHPRQVALLLLFALAYMGTLLLFYVTDRYRLPVIVFLMPLAGAAFSGIKTAFEDRAWRSLALAGSVALFFLYLGLRAPLNPVDLSAFNWGTLSMVYSDLEEDQKAIEAFDKAVALSPVETGASAYVRVSYAYEHLGNDEAAHQALERAIKLFPQSGIVLYNYARFNAARGKLPEALGLFEKAAELSPFYLLNYYALAKGYAQLGQIDKARHFVQKGLALDASDPLLRQALDEVNEKEKAIK